MNRGSNEIAAIKMMAVYMPRVLDIEKGWEREREKSWWYAPLLGFQKSGAHRIYPFDKN